MTVELDKLDIHNRQQLSALMDGELSPDEARFLLRRLQHDGELNACWERWQLCGDVLRGQAQVPAPEGFAARVALAVAAEARQPAANQEATGAPRGRLARWGGGALAASVALVALFMVRQQAPQEDAASAAPSVAAVPAAPAEDAGVPATVADTGTLADGAGAAEQALASAATAAVAVASVPRRADAASRRSATRTQQAARSAAGRVMREPVRAVARATPPVAVPAIANNTPVLPVSASPASAIARNGDPFSPGPAAPQARPWPRSTLSQYPASGAFNAGFSSDAGARTFYPFEPSTEASSVPPVEPARAPQR